LAVPPLELAEFIDKERLTIVAEWESFARTLLPAADGLNALALRDHADEILTAIIRDMKSRQTTTEQAEKSKGRGQAHQLGEMGGIHATLRIEIGFRLGQMVAEYRALRASVLRLWEKVGGDPGGVTRFNESIDEALTVAVDSFTETTERYRDQSLGILSHDLRNPLSGIILGSTMLMRSEGHNDNVGVTCQRILNSARRMDRMIGDLLDLTRTRFGKQIPVVRAPIDLVPLCRQVLAELEGQCPGRLLFSSEGDLHGEWDGDRIAQVLSNLIRNAIQHGGPTDPISLVARDGGDEVLLTVHNGGRPVPAEAIAHIFEPMVRHVGDEQVNVGLGLGLFIAFQVVVAHQGTLDVISTADDGTIFTARLPRHARPEHETHGAGIRPTEPRSERAAR
jgi:signal transduction histidine kinase